MQWACGSGLMRVGHGGEPALKVKMIRIELERVDEDGEVAEEIVLDVEGLDVTSTVKSILNQDNRFHIDDWTWVAYTPEDISPVQVYGLAATAYGEELSRQLDELWKL